MRGPGAERGRFAPAGANPDVIVVVAVGDPPRRVTATASLPFADRDQRPPQQGKSAGLRRRADVAQADAGYAQPDDRAKRGHPMVGTPTVAPVSGPGMIRRPSGSSTTPAPRRRSSAAGAAIRSVSCPRRCAILVSRWVRMPGAATAYRRHQLAALSPGRRSAPQRCRVRRSGQGQVLRRPLDADGPICAKIPRSRSPAWVVSVGWPESSPSRRSPSRPPGRARVGRVGLDVHRATDQRTRGHLPVAVGRSSVSALTLAPRSRSMATIMSTCGSDGKAGPRCRRSSPAGKRQCHQQQAGDELAGGALACRVAARPVTGRGR